MERKAPIPKGLDEMVPGPFLAGILASIDVTALSGHDRLVVLRAHKRMASFYDGHVYSDMAAVSDHLLELDGDVELADESAVLEIRAALRLTRRAAESELGLANDLRHRLPRVLESLLDGEIDDRRARVISNETAHLPDATARRVVQQVIDDAPGLTTGQLGVRVRRLCIETDPGEALARYETAVEDRRFVTEANETGTASMHLFDVAPDRAVAAAAHVDYLAKHLKRSGESRTMDQLRADVAMDLLCGASDATPVRRGVVDIHVDLETLARLSETPGDLGGYGPVVADIARQVAEAESRSELRFTVDDPESGLPVQVGTTRRRPLAVQRRHVEARSHTCVFPGCRVPATGCDIDHGTAWADGGPTQVNNLDPLCRHDHVGKHKFGWKRSPLPDGDHLWVSRLGHRYTTSGRSPP